MFLSPLTSMATLLTWSLLLSHPACHRTSSVNSPHPLIIIQFSLNSTLNHLLAPHPKYAHSTVLTPSTSMHSNLTFNSPPFSSILQQTITISCPHTIPLCQNS